ncbi:MAG: hypothetical protein PHE25_05985 [Candidatus Gracilibacteria bacterium]|nr:hypothetical protein [Candidatus Gracilibacteria bacterium]
MQDIKIWEEKIKEKRKKTEFRDFVKEVASWKTIGLYKNNEIISKFPNTNKIYGVLSNNNFLDYRDNLKNFGINYNFDKDFFSNFQILLKQTKLPGVFHFTQNENSDFSDEVGGVKNCYLAFSCVNNENVLYSGFVRNNCKNIFNSIFVVDNSENIYGASGIINSYNIFFSNYIVNSSDIYFCSDMIGCKECLFCNGLENKSYFINNTSYSKDEYKNIKNKILKDKKNYTFKSSDICLNKNYGSENVVGNFLINSSYVTNGYYSYCIENARNIAFYGGLDNNKDIYDVVSGAGNSRNIYGCNSVGLSDNIFLSSNIIGNSIYYSYFLDGCSFCLGCIGLKNKSFCILNKQYSKEEWYELANKIFFQMDKDGILGDFFPGELNPFYFNDTMAYLIDDSFTKEEVEKDGFMWRNEKIKVDIPENAEIEKTKNLSSFQGFDSNGNWQINPEIMKKVIQDENGNVYKIVPMEYEFLMKHGLPLPEIHWLDRIKLGFKFK